MTVERVGTYTFKVIDGDKRYSVQDECCHLTTRRKSWVHLAAVPKKVREAITAFVLAE